MGNSFELDFCNNLLQNAAEVITFTTGARQVANILVIHGPNLNLLGQREPELYGRTSLEALNQQLIQTASHQHHKLDTFQSNAEHEIVARIHEAPQRPYHGLIMNPAGLSQSVVLRDALLAVNLPFIEVHISNVFAREHFRLESMLADIARGYICGLGHYGYMCALDALFHQLEKH